MQRLSLGAAVAALVLIHSIADARPARLNQVPNGAALGCGLCHVSPSGGGARNVFGAQLEDGFLTSNDFSGTVIWGPELAALDADGDGATNGEELLDPEGAWSAGDANPGDAEQVTLPFDAESFPPPMVTAVEATSWASLKAAVRDLVD